MLWPSVEMPLPPPQSFTVLPLFPALMEFTNEALPSFARPPAPPDAVLRVMVVLRTTIVAAFRIPAPRPEVELPEIVLRSIVAMPPDPLAIPPPSAASLPEMVLLAMLTVAAVALIPPPAVAASLPAIVLFRIVTVALLM